MVRLITIPFSHYCEKARWALDRAGVDYIEEGHLPIFHWRANRRVGAGRTVPVLVDGSRVLGDSTEIVEWADQQRPHSLLPTGAALAEALALEDEFDRVLGPATRRWAYFHLLSRRELVMRFAVDVPRWETIALRFTRPIAVGMIRRSLKIDEAGVARSHGKIEATLARVSELLGDGRRYLVGDRFSVADLTFAALMVPAVLPSELPARIPAVEDLPAAASTQISAWRATPAGQFALRLYREDRAS